MGSWNTLKVFKDVCELIQNGDYFQGEKWKGKKEGDVIATIAHAHFVWALGVHGCGQHRPEEQGKPTTLLLKGRG